MSISAKYASSSDAKAAGWFSRRHQNSEAHFKARLARMNKVRDQQADRENRQEQYNELTPAEKISRLDRIVGEGKGAQKQRAKIMAQAPVGAEPTK